MPAKPRKPGRKPTVAELAALRLAARSAYTLDPEPLTLEQLVCRPAFRVVGLSRLRQWCNEEDWDGQRYRKADSWARRVEAEMPRRRPQRPDDWAERSLQSLHDEALRLRCHPKVQPRSWESVAAFQLRVAQTLHEWRRAAQGMKVGEPEATAARSMDQQTASENSLNSLPPDALADLTEAEYQDGAHHILRKRLGVPESEKEDVKEPAKPRLVRANG